MSKSFDVAGTEERDGKENAPKEWFCCGIGLGHALKKRMTVIRYGWCAIGETKEDMISRRIVLCVGYFGVNMVLSL